MPSVAAEAVIVATGGTDAAHLTRTKNWQKCSAVAIANTPSSLLVRSMRCAREISGVPFPPSPPTTVASPSRDAVQISSASQTRVCRTSERAPCICTGRTQDSRHVNHVGEVALSHHPFRHAMSPPQETQPTINPSRCDAPSRRSVASSSSTFSSLFLASQCTPSHSIPCSPRSSSCCCCASLLAGR